MGEVYVVTSGKGGVGKTTSTANISTGLAMMGKKVVMIDADIGLRNLDVVMGLENRIVYDIIDVIQNTCRLRQALVKDKRFNNLQLLPAAQTKDKSALTPEQMRRVCGMLKEEFDFVIIDCPAGIEQGFQNAVAGAEKAIVVTTPEVSAVRDADRVIGLLEAGGLRDPLLLLNRIKPEMVKHNNMMSLQDVTEVLGIEVLGVVPDDESIVISTNHGEPCVMDDGSWAGQAYRNTTRRLLGEIVPLMKLQQDRGFFNRIIKFLRFGA